MRLKIGIIGTNFISSDFCEAAALIPEAELYAVCSRKQETGNGFAGKHGISRVYTDYDAFLASGLDAVYVASPNFVHCEQTLKALSRGKHVLCEKVMAVNETQVQSMIDCARKNGLILLEAMRPDFDPAYGLIEKALPRLGRLSRATFEFCQYSSRYDRFLNGESVNTFNPDLCNAAVMDIGVYCIHSLVRLFGMPKQIRSCSVKLENGFEGSGAVLLQYDSMTAEAVYSKTAVSVTPSVIQGEKGSLLIDYVSRPETLELRLRKGSRDPLSGGSTEMLPYTPAENNMIYEIRKFIRLIKDKDVNHKYLQYSLDTIRIIDEVRRQNGIIFPGEDIK